MAIWGPKVINSWDQWRTNGSANATIERVMDNSAYTSAHPDDTLVLAIVIEFGTQDASGNQIPQKGAGAGMVLWVG